MARRTSKEGTSKKALIIDTNVIISSMIKTTGYTRTILLTLTATHPSYTPEHAIREIEKHSLFLAEKKNIPVTKQRALLKILTSNIKTISEDHYKEKTQEAKNYVKDPGDTDFVALALKLRENYREIAIITWNTKDYKKQKLRKAGIRVLTPSEALRELLEKPHK
jgi:predicted nucleic acid-binding protein